jgi:hypothetical protein
MVRSATEALQRTLTALKAQRLTLDGQIKAVERALTVMGVRSPSLAGRRRRNPMSAAERRSVSKRMKAYWAKKRRSKQSRTNDSEKK